MNSIRKVAGWLCLSGMLLTACAPATPASPTAAPKATVPKPDAASSPAASPAAKPAASPAASPAAAPASSAGPAVTGPAVTVKVAVLPQIHDGHIMALPEYAKKQNVNVELVPFRRYNDVMVALDKGDIQIGSMGYPNAAYMAESNVRKIKLVSGLSKGAISLTVRNGVEIRDWKDLEGKRVGVLTGGTLEMFYLVALRDNGVDPAKVQQVNFQAPGPEYVQALRSGQLDAFAVFEPTNATVAIEGWGHYAPTELSKNSFGGVNGALGVNTDFLAQQPDAVVGVLRALDEATAFLKANPEKWAELTASQVSVTPQVALEAIKHLELDTNLYEENIQKVAGFLFQTKLVQRDHSTTVSEYLDYAPLMKATGKTRAQLGGK